jgi:hypothetical protein
MWVVLATMMAPVDGARSIITQNLPGIKRQPLKSGFPTPWNVRHYPYLDNRHQKTMVFCSVYKH